MTLHRLKNLDKVYFKEMIIFFMGHISLNIDITHENETTKCKQFFFT